MTQLLPFPTATVPGTGPHGSRSNLTCLHRCGNACDKPVPNTSGNRHVHEVVEQALARRALLKGSAAGAAVLAVSGLVAGPAAAAPAPAARPARGPLGRVEFAPVAPNKADRVTTPPGFRSDVLIRWGDPVTADAPRFAVHDQTPWAAARQFGYNCDYVGVLPLTRKHSLLVVNHEYTDEQLMFPTGTDPETVKKVAMASHGMSVVQIERGQRAGSYRVTPPSRSRYNRRLHTGSQFLLDGPAAGDARLRTSADRSGRRVLGTLNNCAGGMTPWGTVLSGEENFNQYFEKSGEIDLRYAESYARYGIDGNSARGWASVDPRFDLTAEPHEPFRFGWVVEVDPYDPRSTPVKHTMLGRFKHEGANVTIAPSGHAVAYMGDDERGDYLYKFVSAGRFDPRDTQSARRRNMELLSSGTLYVARLEGDGSEDGEYDGSGQWIPLTSHKRSYVEGMSIADVLIDTRLAADKVAPTRMDRPEDIEPNPVNGKVYCALTNNSLRGATFAPDEANPVTTSMVRASLDAPLTPASGNRNGYVLELTEKDDDPTRRFFTWNLLLVCGDPDAEETYFAGFPKDKVSPISCPDNVAFDAVGNLWVSTDGNVLGSNDGLFRVPVEGPRRGHVEQFLTVPLGAETCGPLISKDQKSVFVAVQHPGEVDGATFESPASTWPHTDRFPRPSVVVAYQS